MAEPRDVVHVYFQRHVNPIDQAPSAESATELLTLIRDDFRLSRALVDAIDDSRLTSQYEAAELRLADALGAVTIPTWDWVRDPTAENRHAPMPWPGENRVSFSRGPIAAPCPTPTAFNTASAGSEALTTWKAVEKIAAEQRHALQQAALRIPKGGYRGTGHDPRPAGRPEPSQHTPVPGTRGETLQLYLRATDGDPMLAERGKAMADAILARADAGIAAVQMQAAMMRRDLGFHSLGQWLGDAGDAHQLGAAFATQVVAAAASAERNLASDQPGLLCNRAINALGDRPFVRADLMSAARNHGRGAASPRALPDDAPLYSRLANARQITTLPSPLQTWTGRDDRDAVWHRVMAEGAGTLDPPRARSLILELDAAAEMLATLRHRAETATSVLRPTGRIDDMERALAVAYARLGGRSIQTGQPLAELIANMTRFTPSVPRKSLETQTVSTGRPAVYGGAGETVRALRERLDEQERLAQRADTSVRHHLDVVRKATPLRTTQEILADSAQRSVAEAAAAIEAHPHAGDVDVFWARMAVIQDSLTALELARIDHDLGALGFDLAGVTESAGTALLRELFRDRVDGDDAPRGPFNRGLRERILTNAVAGNEVAARIAFGRDLRTHIIANARGVPVGRGPGGVSMSRSSGDIFRAAWLECAFAHVGHDAATPATQERLDTFTDPINPKANTPFRPTPLHAHQESPGRATPSL